MCGTLLKAGHDDFLLSRKAFISTGNSRAWQHRIYTHTRPRPPTAHSHTAVAWLYTRQNLIANVCYVVRTKLPSAVWVCLPVYHFSNLKAALKAYAFHNHHELRKCSWFQIRNDFWARPTESTPTGNGQIPIGISGCIGNTHMNNSDKPWDWAWTSHFFHNFRNQNQNVFLCFLLFKFKF